MTYIIKEFLIKKVHSEFRKCSFPVMKINNIIDLLDIERIMYVHISRIDANKIKCNKFLNAMFKIIDDWIILLRSDIRTFSEFKELFFDAENNNAPLFDIVKQCICLIYMNNKLFSTQFNFAEQEEKEIRIKAAYNVYLNQFAWEKTS